MNAMISPETQATLLLCAPLLPGPKDGPVPLSTAEFGRLLAALRTAEQPLSALLDLQAAGVPDAVREKLEPERLAALLQRGLRLSDAVERWQRVGLWVVSRCDEDYPPRLLDRLGDKAPPLLYGCGDRGLASTGGLAVVGSRETDDQVLAATREVGALAAAAEVIIVSGGARGIDQAAMNGCLAAGGRAVGVLSDRLERQVLQADWREPIRSGRLLLLSPYDPAAGFQVGLAMGRNKLIYALSDAALVMKTDHGQGGTWAGAVEQLDKHRWVPLYLRAGAATAEATGDLARRGARTWPAPATADSLTALLRNAAPPTPTPPPDTQLSLF